MTIPTLFDPPRPVPGSTRKLVRRRKLGRHLATTAELAMTRRVFLSSFCMGATAGERTLDRARLAVRSESMHTRAGDGLPAHNGEPTE